MLCEILILVNGCFAIFMALFCIIFRKEITKVMTAGTTMYSMYKTKREGSIRNIPDEQIPPKVYSRGVEKTGSRQRMKISLKTPSSGPSKLIN